MKNQKGAITLITLGTVIFIIAFLLSSFVIISNRLQAQAEIKKETKNLYAKDLNNMDKIYKSYFPTEVALVPVTNAEQLLSIGSGKDFVIDGKIYNYASNKNYNLKNNIEINVSTYKTKYPNMFAAYTIDGASVQTWIGINELKSKNILSGNFSGGDYVIRITSGTRTISYYKDNNFSN